MKQTVTLSMFREAFAGLRPDNFSYRGLEALFKYLEEREEDTGNEEEFDVIELCCSFTEYEDLEELRNNYSSYDFEDLDEVEDYTTVIRIDSESFIIQNF